MCMSRGCIQAAKNAAKSKPSSVSTTRNSGRSTTTTVSGTRQAYSAGGGYGASAVRIRFGGK